MPDKDVGRFALFQLVSLYQMLEKYASAFFLMGQYLEMSVQYASWYNMFKEGESFDEERLHKMIAKLMEVYQSCENCGLPISAMTIKELLDRDASYLVPKNLEHDFEEISNNLRRELQSFYLFHVPTDLVPYLNEETPFGERVFKAFPSANFDISEANKCYALGRPTASVMHLMRALEVGMKALAKDVGVAVDHNLSWDSILGKIDTELPKRYPAGYNQTDAEFYADAARHIRTYIKARNRTQHAEKKYLPEEAKRIMDAVHDLMDHLASRLSEPSEV